MQLYHTRRSPTTWPKSCLQTGLLGHFRHVEIEPEPPRAKKTNRQDDLATAQEVKALGVRNAKPAADREVLDDYIQHVG